ncbi:TPA: hypothetical protein OT951_005862 [Pseudomonas aeruginosa]|nr:hypothetical protein [Pseudomonas aeruginosa]HBO1502325.1 hypothetical protein [Pseudomonas aeruginosa]HCT8044490.1 hypothetical protein [Pseudomonas aeruginosa]
MRESITEDALQALIAAGGARDTLVTRGPGGEGWQLLVRYAGGRRADVTVTPASHASTSPA